MKSIFEPPLRRQEGGGIFDDQDKAKSAAINGFQNHLELSLGISSDNSFNVTTSRAGGKGHGGDSAGESSGFLAATDDLVLHQRNEVSSLEEAKWWPNPAEIHSGFIHPWSLAARQQKAVFEQAHQKHSNYSSSMPRAAHLSSLPLIVGWPPVRASRKNLVSLNLLKQGMDGKNDAKRPKLVEIKDDCTVNGSAEPARLPMMFVKVNMEGYVVGRKIDLKAYDSYQSLSQALCKLFRNFLSTNYLNNSKEQDDKVAVDDFILLYEDNEGDQMLVGDIPWELFITSVKKLYIAHNPKKAAAGGEAKKP